MISVTVFPLFFKFILNFQFFVALRWMGKMKNRQDKFPAGFYFQSFFSVWGMINISGCYIRRGLSYNLRHYCFFRRGDGPH